MALLKNTLSLSILARYMKNGVLRSTILNVMDSRDVFRFMNLIDKVLSIPNIKFADLAIVLSSYTEVSGCYNAFVSQYYLLIKLRHLNQ